MESVKQWIHNINDDRWLREQSWVVRFLSFWASLVALFIIVTGIPTLVIFTIIWAFMWDDLAGYIALAFWGAGFLAALGASNDEC